MQANDFDRFHALMTGMAETHQRELSKFMLDAYWLALRDWTLADFEDAVAHFMQTSKWFPKPSEFTDLRKAAEPGPSEAWEEAIAACRHWRNPAELPDGLVARAANCVGGFRAIAMADMERDLPHLQRRFMAAYEELKHVEGIRESVPQITCRQEGSGRISREPGLQLLGGARLELDDV